MAPQGNIPVAANVLSTIGTVFWCVQLLPQIWHNWRKKDTTGLPGSMMLLWTVCSVPFGTYDIVQNFAIPLIIQPQVFGTLALVVWAQCLYYGSGWSVPKTLIAAFVVWFIAGGIEALLILTLRPVYDRGVEWPMYLVGSIAAFLLIVGFIPVYIEIFRRNGRVVGINFVFLLVDWMGAFFSLMGVVTQETFDVLGGVIYICCAVIELGIFISQGIWLLRTRSMRKRAKELKIDFDDLPEAQKYVWPRRTDEQDDSTSVGTQIGSPTQTLENDLSGIEQCKKVQEV